MKNGFLEMWIAGMQLKMLGSQKVWLANNKLSSRELRFMQKVPALL